MLLYYIFALAHLSPQRLRPVERAALQNDVWKHVSKDPHAAASKSRVTFFTAGLEGNVLFTSRSTAS